MLPWDYVFSNSLYAQNEHWQISEACLSLRVLIFWMRVLLRMLSTKVLCEYRSLWINKVNRAPRSGSRGENNRENEWTPRGWSQGYREQWQNCSPQKQNQDLTKKLPPLPGERIFRMPTHPECHHCYHTSFWFLHVPFSTGICWLPSIPPLVHVVHMSYLILSWSFRVF